MKTLTLSLFFFFTLPVCMEAQSLNEYRWKSRLVLLFTPSPDDPMFERQIQLLSQQTEALEERNLVFLFITPDGKFENTGRFLPEAAAEKFYKKFGPEQYRFEMVLVGLDGYEKFRAVDKITPPSVLISLIDGMPMRRRELLEEHGTKSPENAGNASGIKKQRDF